MNFIKNKRGTDKVLSVYWFAVLFIVVTGVVYMTFLYYGKPYDVRDIEANLLLEKVSDCLSNGGRLSGEWNSINSENFPEKCSLNFNVEDTGGWKKDQYYVNVKFRNFNEDSFSELAEFGNPNLEIFCGKSVVCSEREFYTLDKENKQYSIKIKSVVGKTEKNE